MREILNLSSPSSRRFTACRAQPLRAAATAVVQPSAWPVVSLAAALMGLGLDLGQVHADSPRAPCSLKLLDTVINCPTHGSLDSPVRGGTLYSASGLPWWLRWKSVCLQCRRPGSDSWVRKIPWRRKWQSTPVFLPGESHGRRSLAGYSPWGHKELDTAE